MRAIILAAGEGIRLRPHTLDRPKCLVSLAGRPLLTHQIEALTSAGIDRITIVTGHRADRVVALGYPTRHNPDYARTNMVASLMCAADLLDGRDDVLIAYGDVVYEPQVVEALWGCSEPIGVAVNTAWLKLWQFRMDDPLSDAETLKLDGEGNIIELGKRARSYDDVQGQYMGLVKVRADFALELVEIHRQLDPDQLYDSKDLPNMYMTSFLQHLIDLGIPVRAVPVDGGWLEVDSTTDLRVYDRLASEGRLDEFCRIGRAMVVA